MKVMVLIAIRLEAAHSNSALDENHENSHHRRAETVSEQKSSLHHSKH